jgi:Predicted RNA-binding protein
VREIIETGKTIDEAIEKACEMLGIPREEAVSVEVIETPQKKLFSSIPAKVRVVAEGGEEPAPVKEDKTEKEIVVETKTDVNKKEDKSINIREEEPYTSEKATAAVEYIIKIASAMGIENYEVEIVKRREAVIIKITGEEASPLIGRRGEAMEALTVLASLVANNLGGDYEKISVDVNNYSAKREKDLMQLAKRVGSQVAKTGKSHNFEPMNSYERRIIHSIISEMHGVKSESFGEGPNRHIVVTSTNPNKNRNFRGQSSNRNSNYQDKRPKHVQEEQIKEKAEDRDGKSPDAELLEKLSTEGKYGKIDI